MISVVYSFRTHHTRSFATTLALLPAIVCVVIAMVNGSVGAGVAVAGAFSLVRFRSVPGSGKDISFVFLAMTAHDGERPPIKVGNQGLYREGFEHDACGIGAIANIKGVKSHQLLDDALSVLVNLEHRGGKGLEENTGDGAGILFQVPHRFFRKEAQKCGHLLPDEGDYGVAMQALPA